MLLAGRVMEWPSQEVVSVLSVGRELAANAIGVGNQEGRAKPVAQIAVGVVFVVEHLFGGGKIGRGQHVDVAFAGKVGGDLDEFHAAARGERHAGELGLGGAAGGAREGHKFLTADFSYVLRGASHGEKGSRQ